MLIIILYSLQYTVGYTGREYSYWIMYPFSPAITPLLLSLLSILSRNLQREILRMILICVLFISSLQSFSFHPRHPSLHFPNSLPSTFPNA